MKDVELPLLSEATSLAAHTAAIAMRTKNASVNTLNLGRGVQWPGNRIASVGINAQALHIQKTTSAAGDLIQMVSNTSAPFPCLLIKILVESKKSLFIAMFKNFKDGLSSNRNPDIQNLL